MTTVTTFDDSADSQVVVVAAERIDALVESLPEARARAAVICSMVYEMCAALRWLQETDTPLEDAATEELASIGQLARAAQDHYLRMSSLPTGAPGRDPR
jgi:hypothetical protein